MIIIRHDDLVRSKAVMMTLAGKFRYFTTGGTSLVGLDGTAIAGSAPLFSIGGSGAIFGANLRSLVYLVRSPGEIVFSSDFNVGGDAILVQGGLEGWTVRKSGSYAVFENDDMRFIVPVGAGTYIRIGDTDGWPLRFDPLIGSIFLGQMPIGETASILDPGTLGPTMFVPINPFGSNQSPLTPFVPEPDRLFLNGAADTTYHGRASIFGTTDREHLTLGGVCTLDASFNLGGDEITFETSHHGFVAVVEASSIHLRKVASDFSADIWIPIGTAGLELHFTDYDATLLYDSEIGQVRIGQQTVGHVEMELGLPLELPPPADSAAPLTFA